jgi:DNA ligase-1
MKRITIETVREAYSRMGYLPIKEDWHKEAESAMEGREPAYLASFSVGTGFSDAHRENPPPVGSTITFRYQELSDRGVPRFPSFVCLRNDLQAAVPTTNQSTRRAAAKPAKSKPPEPTEITTMTRHFEFVEGSSGKFWEINQAGNDVTVRFGKIGTSGQTQTKSFDGAAAAQKHAEKLIGEKTRKGYVETAG